jgi:hypothetical protein
MESTVLYFNQVAKVACDKNCKKAWGFSNRPNVKLSEKEDDIAWLSDGEMGDAPDDPGTYEGGDAKPLAGDKTPNKWCIRECERCVMSSPGESDKPLPLRDWTNRVYNIPR